MKLSKSGKKLLYIGIAAAAVAIIVAVILIAAFSGRTPVKSVKLSETGVLECNVKASGMIEPLMKYAQKSASDATVKELIVKSGDTVEKGDTVAYLSGEYTDMLLELMRQKDEAEMLVAGGNFEAQTTCDSLAKQIETLLTNKTACDNIFVKADVSGRICRINISNGKNISVGDELFEIDDDRLYTVNISIELWAPLLPYGSSVKLCNSEGKELGFTGKIVKRADTANAICYTLSLEGDCRKYYEDFSFVTAVPDFGSAEGFILPKQAMMKDGAADYVFVCEKGVAKRRNVTVALSDGERVCITDGIKKGETVITSPSKITDGGKVKLING